MPQEIREAGQSVPILAWTRELEASARAQLVNTARLPFLHKHVAVMPDVHWGLGATVGSVIASRSAVIPAAVGVDIGCGMCAVRTSLRAEQLPDDLKALRSAIERAVPVGQAAHASVAHDRAGAPLFDARAIAAGYAEIRARHPDIAQRGGPARLVAQLGTLGGGNHFIELCLDREGALWILLHSGSRNIGKVIAEHFIARAKQHMQREGVQLPEANLAWLSDGTPEFADYVRAVEWAQRYAALNRRTMLELIALELARFFPAFTLAEAVIDCHHNYISRETHFGADVIVTRKGAIRARAGELGIIPGSMGARSYIVRGKGNPESFDSCAHGAGRRMSRGEARRRFTLGDLAEQTAGVECRKDAAVLDEIPGAYKSIDEVMANQTELVEAVSELRQVLCVKG